MEKNTQKNDLLEILSEVFVKQSQIDLLKFVEQWKVHINNGYPSPQLFSVNKLLDQLDSNQIDILKHKFQNTTKYYQMHDIFAELFVASEYRNAYPLFIQEKRTERTPDLFLEKTKEYIEVKVINTSDYSHDFEDFVSRNSIPGMAVTGVAIPFSKTRAHKEILPKLKTKAKEKIDEGGKQLKEKKGFIYLLYRIDEVTDLFGLDYNGYYYDLASYLRCELANFISDYSILSNISIVSKSYNLLHFPNWKVEV